jgi:hypothetical protein
MISKPFPVSNSSNPIAPLQKRFDAWRKSRRLRARIPGPLWNSAVRVAGQYGLHKTARALHLDYYGLKKRIEAAGVKQGPAPSFIELRPSAPEATSECVIELEARNGAKMRITLKGMGSPDLNALSDTFWRGKR